MPTTTPTEAPDTAASDVATPTERSDISAMREQAERAIEAYESLEAQVAAMSDEDFKFDPHKLRRKADNAFGRALGLSAALNRLLHPVFSGALSAPRRRAEVRPLRPDAAPKDGTIVCTGLERFPDWPGCGQAKSSDKFPTSGQKDADGVMQRLTECRECRNKRRDAAKGAS